MDLRHSVRRPGAPVRKPGCKPWVPLDVRGCRGAGRHGAGHRASPGAIHDRQRRMSTLPRRSLVRVAFATFLPLAVLATLLAGLVYGVAQQGLRSGANDPQLRLAEDAARALDAGGDPSAVVGQGMVDVAASLAPFVVVYD